MKLRVTVFSCMFLFSVFAQNSYSGPLSSPQSPSVFEVPPKCPQADFNYRYIKVLVDKDRPELGKFLLHYHVSNGFDSKLPTIVLINDAQALPMASVADAAKSKYPGANFIGVELRGGPCSPIPRAGLTGPSIDWQLAFEVFRSENVLNDYEAVRRDFFGHKRVAIMGGSGGGIMAYQYLGKFGDHVKRALIYTASAEMDSVGANDKANLLRVMNDFGVSQTLAEEVVSKEVEKRKLLRIIDQEIKNHSPQTTVLPQLFLELQAGNRSLYDQLLAKYGDIDKMNEYILTYPSVVTRFFELFPFRETASHPGFPSHPNAMMFEKVTEPLMSLVDQGVLPRPEIDVIKKLSSFKGRFLGIAAEWDDVIPVESNLASCRAVKNAKCLLIQDTHLFASSRPLFESIIKDFFAMAK